MPVTNKQVKQIFGFGSILSAFNYFRPTFEKLKEIQAFVENLGNDDYILNNHDRANLIKLTYEKLDMNNTYNNKVLKLFNLDKEERIIEILHYYKLINEKNISSLSEKIARDEKHAHLDISNRYQCRYKECLSRSLEQFTEVTGASKTRRLDNKIFDALVFFPVIDDEIGRNLGYYFNWYGLSNSLWDKLSFFGINTYRFKEEDVFEIIKTARRNIENLDKELTKTIDKAEIKKNAYLLSQACSNRTANDFQNLPNELLVQICALTKGDDSPLSDTEAAKAAFDVFVKPRPY